MKLEKFRLNIGEIIISYEYNKPIDSNGNEPFNEFISSGNVSNEMANIINKVSVVSSISPVVTNRKLIASTLFWKMWDYSPNYRIDFINNESLLTCRVITNSDFSVNRIMILDSIIQKTVFLPSDVHALLMNGYLCYHDFGLLLHGSMVQYKQKGIVFSGVSGSGKSTISSLVAKHMNLPIVTDDRVLIRFKKRVECFSTPYDWKIERCKNIKTDLGCIVYVKHGLNTNAIHALSREEKFNYLFTTNLLPFYIPGGLIKTYKAFSFVIDSIPIFEYSFIPNEESVDHLFLYVEDILRRQK